MNQQLMASFTDSKIQSIVFQMNGIGAPGPNGFPAYFFQKNQFIVGKEVYHYVREVL